MTTARAERRADVTAAAPPVEVDLTLGAASSTSLSVDDELALLAHGGYAGMRTRPRRMRSRRASGFLLRSLLWAVTLVLLPVLAVLAALIALAIVLDSPGSVLYRCPRIGWDGKAFDMLKFRKMRTDASGPALTSINDARFTPIGRFLAVTRLDELPQIWNIVRGDMRLVGPRPEVAEFVSLHAEQYEVIHSVRPGLTGLAQLEFAGEARRLSHLPPEAVSMHYGKELMPAKIELDRRYVAEACPLLDLRILVATLLLPLRTGFGRAHGGLKAISMSRVAAVVLPVMLVLVFSIQAGS